jgi:hypothetical protein
MNPMNLIQNYMMRGINNPIFNNLISMAKNGDEKGLENFARNLMKERGKDFDKEFAQFKSSMK